MVAGAGALVAINYRNRRDAAEAVLARVEGAGGRAELVGFDVADSGAAADAIDGLAKRHGRLDILVNNAGIAIDQLLLRVKPADLEATWATNLNGAIYCAKAAIRPMMRARRGRIVFVSSVVGEAGNPGQTAYAASKAALLGVTKTLAREYASRGVTVNAVSPGYIDTDMTAALSDEVRGQALAQVPAGRMGTAAEVASAVLYLATDEAAYVNGHVLRVNGAMYC